MEVVHDWLTEQPKDFFYQGIYASMEHWRQHVECGGNYMES